MKYHKLIPTLYTKDLPSSIKFYTVSLGFTCTSFEPENGWASICRDDVEIMLTLPNDHRPFEKPLFTGSFYIKVKNVDLLWASLKQSKNISYPLEEFEYGMKEFAIYDNNGYLLQFAEEI